MVLVQTLKTVIRIGFLLTLTGTILYAPPADANKKTRVQRVELTGIQSFDTVFRKAREAEKQLKGAERNVRVSKQSFRRALKLGKRTTYIQGLQELKNRAEGKLTVVLQGGVPTLRAKDAVPSDVMAGVDAVNALAVSIPAALRHMKDVSAASSSMYTRVKKFPNNVQAELASTGADGLIALAFRAPKIAKTILGNLKIIGSMPKRAAVVSKDLGQISNAIRTTFM